MTLKQGELGQVTEDVAVVFPYVLRINIIIVFSQGLVIHETSVTPQVVAVIDTVFLAGASAKLCTIEQLKISTRGVTFVTTGCFHPGSFGFYLL
jgi:hypothetical protein